MSDEFPGVEMMREPVTLGIKKRLGCRSTDSGGAGPTLTVFPRQEGAECVYPV